MSKPVILTGLRANGELHLGNYLGGILPLIELQRRHAGEYQVNMFVPDLHSFITPINHAELYRNTLQNLRVFVAAGLNLPDDDTYIYRQSYISAHSELAWILNCFTGMGELERMTQYKDKRSETENESRVAAGLLNYPVLMAADILLYGAQYIPVGEDQRQHIELTRDLAIRLNNKFEQNLFVVPEAWNEQIAFAQRDSGVRIKSLRNPAKKMSKSIEDPSGTIMLSDDPSIAAKKIMKAETDAIGIINYDIDNQPGISNLLQILALLSGASLDSVVAKWTGSTSYGDLKKTVAAAVEAFLMDFQNTLSHVDESRLLNKLERDESMMNEQAQTTLQNIQRAVGLRP